MKSLITVVLVLMLGSLQAQDSFTEADARGIIDTFFEGFHAGDTVKMKSVMVDNLPTQTVFKDKEGNNRVSNGTADRLLEAIANRPAEQKWDERLFGYQVKIDGNLAHVWTPYQFWLNGEMSHCGANAFTLGKTDDGWKILHLIDSRRREGCSM